MLRIFPNNPTISWTTGHVEENFTINSQILHHMTTPKRNNFGDNFIIFEYFRILEVDSNLICNNFTEIPKNFNLFGRELSRILEIYE